MIFKFSFVILYACHNKRPHAINLVVLFSARNYDTLLRMQPICPAPSKMIHRHTHTTNHRRRQHSRPPNLGKPVHIYHWSISWDEMKWVQPHQFHFRLRSKFPKTRTIIAFTSIHNCHGAIVSLYWMQRFPCQSIFVVFSCAAAMVSMAKKIHANCVETGDLLICCHRKWRLVRSNE